MGRDASYNAAHLKLGFRPLVRLFSQTEYEFIAPQTLPGY